MSNKITLATIQFRADTKGVNPALDAMRQSSKDAHDEVDRLQEALDKGIKRMKDANGVEFDVADKFRQAQKAAKSYDQALRELVKGATALESVVQNIRLGEIEKSSRAELKGAINAAEARKRSVRESDPEDLEQQRELNQVIEESRKQLNNLDRDTQKVIETIDKGGVIAQATLDKEIKGLKEILTLIPKGTDEWNKYNQQLTQMEAYVDSIRRQEREAAVSLLDSKDFGGYSEEEIRTAITNARELLSTYKTASPEAKALADNIVRADQYLKEHGIEAARQAAREKEQLQLEQELAKTMNKRLRDLKNLSADALVETRKYWEAQKNGAVEGTTEFNKAEAALKKIDGYQRNARRTELGNILGDPSKFGVSEVKAAVQEVEKLRDSVQKGIPVWFQYNKMVEQGREYLDRLAKKAAEQTMSWKQAMQVSSQAGKGSFKGSVEQLTQAKKVLEEMSAKAVKGGLAWRRMQEALQRIGVELKNVGHLSQEVQSVLDSPKGRSFNALKQAVEQGRLALNAMDRTTKEGQKQFDELAKKVKVADQEMKQLTATSKGTSTAFEKAWSRVKTYIGVYVGTAVAMQKVTATMGDLMDLSDRMGEVRKTTGFTADEVGRLSENLKKMDVRTSLTSLMEISASAGQLGLKTLEDVQGFTEAANKLMIALPEMGREAATEMMRVAIATGEVDKIRKQLQEGTIEGSSATAVAMEKIASTIDRLRASSASTAPEITDFVKRVGAVGAQSGITIDQVAALGSTVSSLGMRIEMSATALSRMIPAIRNNAFELAKAIGVTPDTIRNLFDTGRGMEAILMILQRIKDTGMDADSVEQMLGMAGMRDIMKDLNQQGARAGIVFSGLSQNVDELRRQLGVASEAYEENIAIQQEFDKMNETTAAKWERLKNAFEEMFVGDEVQRGLGVLIDGLRKAVDLINDLHGYILRISIAFAAWKAGVGGAIWTYLINPIRLAITGVHSLSFQVKGLAATWRTAWKSMDAATKTNWIVALSSAIFMLGKYIYDTANRVSELDQALNELQHEESNNEHILNRLVTTFNNVSTKAAEATKKHDELEKKTKELNDEVDQLKKSTDLSSEATETLKKKEDELKKTKEELNKATDEMNKANNSRLDLIKQINDKYSTYLGYMLSEKTAAEEVATAHQLIISALKEEMAQKRMLRSQEAIENEFGEDIAEWRQNSREELNSGALKDHKDLQQQVMERWESVMARISYDTKKGVFTIPAIEGINGKAVTKRTVEELRPIMQQLLSNTMTKVAKDAGVDRSFYFGQAGTATDKAQTGWGGTYGSWSADDGFARWTEATLLREQRIQQQYAINNAGLEGAHTQTVEDAKANIKQNRDNLLDLVESNKTFTEEQIRKMAQNVNAVVAGFNKYGKDLEESSFELVFGKDKEATLENAITTMLAGVGEDVRKRVLKTANAAATSPNGTGSINTTTTNPWGTSERADSTTYTEMTAEQLVNRREQMNKFVNSLQTDTDVKAVLNEDAALMKAIEAGMSSDMRTVIEWYNTERLKIQDELHARHLTNTGDWLDPKKERGAKKQFRDEMDAYLHELDAYYTERKTRIEQARNDEEITEGEAWRRTIQNDNEWQTRRAELQKLYSRKQKEVTQEELDAIIRIIAERTGDSESFVKAAIAKTNQFVNAIEKSGDKGAAIVHRWMSQVELDTERSYLKAAQAIGKQMKFIEDTLAKERPYDGITKNLQDNLDKMGVLAAKYRRENEELARQNKEPKYSNEQITAQSYDEMAFYLRQAADAYSIDIDELLRRMVKEGMTATAEEISKSDMLKQAVMGQLRKTYQEVQDAVKKEASQIKKDVEIIWNDDARGIGGMSMKATFDKALAQLGMQQDSVSRANSLIGAGAASDNVASRIAMKQIEVQMRMQKAQYDMYRVQANQRMAALKAEAEEHRRLAKQMEKENHLAESKRELLMATNAERDAENVRLSLGLTLAEETKKEEQQKAELLKIQEESQNRLYTSLREWADLLTSSLQGVFEANHAGDAEYYNERAKLNLTGKGGPGAGTYVVIDDAGTSAATAHYEYLDERQALERQHEIEIQNAQAEAWRKLMDDINMKMSEQITDWMNAYLQNKATEDNTAELQHLQQKLEAEQQKMDASITATDANTQAVQELTQQLAEGITIKQDGTQPGATGGSDFAADKQAGYPSGGGELSPAAQQQINEQNAVTENFISNKQKEVKAETEGDKKEQTSKQSMFAKMTAAANLYGVAYQAMSNDNLDMAQKFEMIALQAVGNAAIAGLQVALSSSTAETATNLPPAAAKSTAEAGPIAGPILFAALSALVGGLLGLAASKVAKSKSQIAQVTGASVSAGRLATGMQTYAEGNVNELTDPASLTPGRQYNVNGADGKTYRARYMGKGAKTHITNGPEFHLVGEAGREAIIDAKTTRLLQMNETGIWRDIQTLYNGGSISGLSTRSRRGGVRSFAEGNVGEFEDAMGGDAIAANGTGGANTEQMIASLDRNSAIQEALLERLNQPIYAQNILYGPKGLPNIINQLNKEAQRHGEKYL